MAEKVSASTKIPQDVSDRVDALCERLEWTRSELLAHCIQYGLEEGEKFAKRIQGPALGPILRAVFMLDATDPEQRKAFDELYKSVRGKAKLAERLEAERG